MFLYMSDICVLQGTSTFGAVFLIINAALGAGLLNFPLHFHKAGRARVLYSLQSIVQCTEYCTVYRVLYSVQSIVQCTEYCTGYRVLYSVQSIVQGTEYCTGYRVLYSVKSIVQCT